MTTKQLVNKTGGVLKNFAKKTAERVITETSPDFKPLQYVGAGLAVAGLAVKIVAVFTPAMPVALISLAPEAISIGLTLFGASSLTMNPDGSAKERKIITIVKNLFKKKKPKTSDLSD